jgi:hypothetical protein
MTTVFIPTRARAHCLVKTLPKWEQQRYVERVVLVVEKWELGKHKRLAKQYKNVEVMRLPNVNRGINFARHWIVEEADRLGLLKIIMSDDDLYPKPDSDVTQLFEFYDLNTLGIGIMLPFYGLMFGNKTIKYADKPLMSKGGLGKRLFSLDVKRVLEVGNFDPKLWSGWGDDELVRQGIKDLGATWYIHPGVHGVSIAGRHTKGGLNDLNGENKTRRQQAEFSCHQYIYHKWGPEYINEPKLGGRLVCQWRKMFDDFVPNWRERVTWVKR